MRHNDGRVAYVEVLLFHDPTRRTAYKVVLHSDGQYRFWEAADSLGVHEFTHELDAAGHDFDRVHGPDCRVWELAAVETFTTKVAARKFFQEFIHAMGRSYTRVYDGPASLGYVPPIGIPDQVAKKWALNKAEPQGPRELTVEELFSMPEAAFRAHRREKKSDE